MATHLRYLREEVERTQQVFEHALGDTAAVSAMLGRLLHHAHVLKCGPKSWRTKLSTTSALRETGVDR